MESTSRAKFTIPNVLASLFLLFFAGESLLIYSYSLTGAICAHLYVLGRSEGCTFQQATAPLDFTIDPQMVRLESELVRLDETEDGLVKWQTPRGIFWAPQGVRVHYALAEQEVDVYNIEQVRVHPGDVVLDCGANIGSFTRRALDAGASKVAAIDPSPRNAECLRRTFATEIEQGRVVVVEEGVWHEPSSMSMYIYDDSMLDSLILSSRSESRTAPTKTEVPLNTIDNIAAALDLDRVDFIKMDVEGAERNAIEGAAGVIERFLPRMSIATENLPDDIRVLPEVVKGIFPGYHQINGGCRICQRRCKNPRIAGIKFPTRSLRRSRPWKQEVQGAVTEFRCARNRRISSTRGEPRQDQRAHGI